MLSLWSHCFQTRGLKNWLFSRAYEASQLGKGRTDNLVTTWRHHVTAWWVLMRLMKDWLLIFSGRMTGHADNMTVHMCFLSKGPSTPETNWHSSRIEKTNGHWNVLEFIHSIRDEFKWVGVQGKGGPWRTKFFLNLTVFSSVPLPVFCFQDQTSHFEVWGASARILGHFAALAMPAGLNSNGCVWSVTTSVWTRCLHVFTLCASPLSRIDHTPPHPRNCQPPHIKQGTQTTVNDFSFAARSYSCSRPDPAGRGDQGDTIPRRHDNNTSHKSAGQSER